MQWINFLDFFDAIFAADHTQKLFVSANCDPQNFYFVLGVTDQKRYHQRIFQFQRVLVIHKYKVIVWD